MAYAVEDLINMALDDIGFPKHIGNIYEGSPAARAALEVYGLTRDDLLAQGDWPFCYGEIALTAVPAQTPLNTWSYEYQYPSDCVRLRQIRPGPLTGATVNNDPQPILYRIVNDSRPTTAVRAILCNQASAIAVYNRRVVDPSTWEPGFTQALVKKLAEVLEFALEKNPDMIKARIALSTDKTAEAMLVDDNAGPSPLGVASGNKR